jgi:hypothetical protein
MQYDNIDKLQHITRTILTELFTQSLQKKIEKQYRSVSSFLRATFRYWERNWRCNNICYKNADIALKKYYDSNHQTYPDSLSEAELDITGLNSIACNILNLSKDEQEFYRSITDIRNKCAHSFKEITKHEFEAECNKIRSIIDDCQDITDNKKYDYKQKLDLFEKEDGHKKLDELLSANLQLNQKLDNFGVKQNKDAKKIDELNQKLENFEVKLVDEVKRINDSTEKNTNAIQQIKQVISGTLVRYLQRDYRVNIKF